MSFIPRNEVQDFLDNIGSEEFTVTFQKSNGEVVSYSAILPADDKRTESVAIKTIYDGYKRFNINSVVSIKAGGIE